ncbi:hypothetical protein BDW68DRAFT_164518 [Aspergillus falconensis]
MRTGICFHFSTGSHWLLHWKWNPKERCVLSPSVLLIPHLRASLDYIEVRLTPTYEGPTPNLKHQMETRERAGNIGNLNISRLRWKIDSGSGILMAWEGRPGATAHLYDSHPRLKMSRRTSRPSTAGTRGLVSGLYLDQSDLNVSSTTSHTGAWPMQVLMP